MARSELVPIVEAMGFDVVDVMAGRSHKTNLVTIIVYRAPGVSLSDLESISKNVYQRLKLLDMAEDTRLEVSSPSENTISA